MKLSLSGLAALAALSLVEGYAPSRNTFAVSSLQSKPPFRSNGPVHAMIENETDAAVTGKELAKNIRECVLTDLNGKKTKLGDVMGSRKSVVVFLRHLG